MHSVAPFGRCRRFASGVTSRVAFHPAAGVILLLAAWFSAPLGAQQCAPAGGGPACETASGIASLGDPDGSDLTVGNPFHPITGNKYQEELDSPPLPGFLGLEIRRHYNAAYAAAQSPWGRGWALSYDTRLYRHAGTLQVVQADGRRLVFGLPPLDAGSERADTACSPAMPGQGQLFIEPGGYRWLWPQQRELLFDTAGRLVQVRPRGGSDAEATRIDRDASGRIGRITDPAGRSLQFVYDRNGHLDRIEHPLGSWRYLIDADGRLQAVTTPDGLVRRYRYEDPAHPSRFTAIAVQAPADQERIVSQWAYDAQGRVVRHRRGDGGELRMDYERPGALSSTGPGEIVTMLTNALGATTRFKAREIDGRLRVTEIAGPGCEECAPGNVRMRYDRQGQLVVRQRIGGEGLEYRRDSRGRVVRILRPHASGSADADYLLRFEYADDQTHLPRLVARPSVVAGKEHRILLPRDARGNPLEVLESGYSPGMPGEPPRPIARHTRLRYQETAGRLVLKEIDGPLPNGPAADPSDSDITRFSHDDAGRFLQAVEMPGGSTRRVVARDTAGRETATVSSDGFREVEQRLEYDHRHRVLNFRETAWLLEAGRRIPASAIVTTISHRFDALGRPLQSRDAAGRTADYRHDAAGRLLAVVDAQGFRAELSRDAEGNLLRTALLEPGAEEPLRAAHYGRNRDGRLDTLLLPDGRRFGFHYDIHAQPFAVSGPDRQLRLVATGTAGGRNASTIVDDFGRVIRQALPDHGLRIMRYDDAGRLTFLTDAAGATFAFRHDAAGNMVERTATSQTAEETVTFGYQGRLQVQVDDPVQSTRWRRDAAGRIIETSIVLAGLPGPPLRTTRARDPATGLTRVHGLADGRSMTLHRHGPLDGAAPRQIDLKDPFWRAVQDLLEQWLPPGIAARVGALLPATVVARHIVVHPFDGLTAFTSFNGSVMKRMVDAAGRTASLRVEIGGRPLAHWRYGYGSGPRLASIEDLAALARGEKEGLLRFAYDASGRLEQQASDLSAGMPLVPAGAGDVPASAVTDEHGLVFDQAGRVIGDGRFRYEYTARGQVASVLDLRTQRRIASYAYNHRGQRVRKIVHSADGEGASTRYFLWDEQRLAAEIGPDGRILAQYLALDDGRRILPIARLENPGVRRLRVGGGGAQDRAFGGSVLAIHADHRGAPVALTDARGRLAWQAEVASSGRAAPASVSRGIEMNLRLPGQYFDRETGLHDNWHRTYDPERGRFLQPDPLGYPDGPDTYAYAGGDPVNRVDPLGLYEIDVHYYMTFFLAVTAGLAPDEARIVALAAQYVDHNPLTRPVDSGHVGSTVASVLQNQARLLNYHFVLSGNDGRTLPQYRNARLDAGDSPQLANLLDAVHAAGISRNASLQFLGEYLHALADTYSHRNARNIPYDALVLGCGVGHGLDMHEPDLTYDDIPPWTRVGLGVPIGRTAWRREARTLAMELELHGVLLAVGDPSRAREASEIEATLREFNAIRESESRGADFAQKIALLQSRLSALGYGHIDLRNDELFGYNEREASTNRVAFLRNPDTGAPLREEDFPGVCLEGGSRCRPR